MGGVVRERSSLFAELANSRGSIGIITADRIQYQSMHPTVTHCIPCGAPLTSNGCEYCGTGRHKKSIPLSPSERIRIENEIKLEYALPKRSIEDYQLRLGEWFLSFLRLFK